MRMRVSPPKYPAQFELKPGAIYVLQQLRGVNFPYIRLPNVNDGYFAGPSIETVYTVSPNVSEGLETHLNAPCDAQHLLFRGSAAAVAAPPRLYAAGLLRGRRRKFAHLA